jgi:hypothetical protein
MAKTLEERVAPFTNACRAQLVPVDPSRPCGGRMKGFALLHLVEHANATFGAEAMTGWQAGLEPRHRELTNTAALTSVGWLPVELYFSAVQHLVATHHQGQHRRALELGHTMAERAIGAFFRTVMSFTTPPTVLSLAGRFWRSYFDFGSLAVTEKTTSTAEVELRDWPLLSEVAFYELVGSFVAWMEASKGKDVSITRLALTAPECLTLTLQWS